MWDSKIWLKISFSLLFSTAFCFAKFVNDSRSLNHKSSSILKLCPFILSKHEIAEIAKYQAQVKLMMDATTSSSYAKSFYKTYTSFIDRYGPRFTGTETLEQAIDYINEITHQNGIDDVFTEELEVPYWKRGKESAVMLTPRRKKIAILGLGESVPTPPEGITANAVVVKSFSELEDMEYYEVAGKIVVFNAEFVGYEETVKYRFEGASKAAVKGAVASLIRSITPFSLYTLHTGHQEYADKVNTIPTASITAEDANLLDRLYQKGETITLHIKMDNTLEYKISRNTLIDLKGREKPEKLVFVSGHIDSWDVGEGAMDDGGGMFISWFVPIILRKFGQIPRRTIRAALWTAEEEGYIGSAAYIKRHLYDLDNINFILESDIGTFKPLGLDIAGSPKAFCIIAEILKLFPTINKVKLSEKPGTDLTQFVEKGIPGASLLNENERYFFFHHTEADTMDLQNMTNVIECAAFWASVSFVIADLSFDIPRY